MRTRAVNARTFALLTRNAAVEAPRREEAEPAAAQPVGEPAVLSAEQPELSRTPEPKKALTLS